MNYPSTTSIYCVMLSNLIDQFTGFTFDDLSHGLFSTDWCGPGSGPVTEQATGWCVLFCLFGFDFIGLTLSQSLNPFVNIQRLPWASAQPHNDTDPVRKALGNCSHFWWVLQGFLSSERWYQTPEFWRVIGTEIFLCSDSRTLRSAQTLSSIQQARRSEMESVNLGQCIAHTVKICINVCSSVGSWPFHSCFNNLGILGISTRWLLLKNTSMRNTPSFFPNPLPSQMLSALILTISFTRR